jgi:hypothetical protein
MESDKIRSMILGFCIGLVTLVTVILSNVILAASPAGVEVARTYSTEGTSRISLFNTPRQCRNGPPPDEKEGPFLAVMTVYSGQYVGVYEGCYRPEISPAQGPYIRVLFDDGDLYRILADQFVPPTTPNPYAKPLAVS